MVHTIKKIFLAPGYGAGVRSTVTIPGTVIGNKLTLMTMADASDLDLNICHMSIDRVGPGLPCTLQFAKESVVSQAIQYSKSVDTKEYNDIAQLDLGKT